MRVLMLALTGLLIRQVATKKKAKLDLRRDVCFSVSANKSLTFWHRSFTFNSNKSPT